MLIIIYASFHFFNREIKPQRAFYYWQNQPYFLSETESQTVNKLKVKKLYIKFFEVDYNDLQGIFPFAKNELNLSRYDTIDTKIEVVPTVYIRNEVFKQTSKKVISELANNILFLIEKKFKKQYEENPIPKEIQMDCDWTESTKDNYHWFLTILKEKMLKNPFFKNIKTSATLRLYAYKFPDKMGVLPVDRAMLMCYNLIPPFDAGDRNSILNISELDKYLVGSDSYPLPLDIALPIYSSVQVYQNNSFAGIIYSEDSTFVKQTKKLNNTWYLSKMDTAINGIFIRKGDKLKVEKMNFKLINKAIKSILEHVELDEKPTISLFHLEDYELTNFTNEELDSCFNYFKHY
ncbi:MAG: hypothetical protein ACKO7P_06905 [Bacteroidota bacterium]